MQAIHFHHDGHPHSFLIPGNELAVGCALEIIQEKCYPLRPMRTTPKVIVDLGAHVGEFTIIATLTWPDAEVHAYEPYWPAFEVLKHNLQKFPNVQVYPVGVACAKGSVPLHISGCGSLCNSVSPEVVEQPTGEKVWINLIDCRTIPSADIIKIDIEGHEPEILRGMNAWDTPRVYVEFHSEDDRRKLHELFEGTHSLVYARIEKPYRGEMMWEKVSLPGQDQRGRELDLGAGWGE